MSGVEVIPGAAQRVAQIVQEMPHPLTDADLLRALVKAERAGYERAQEEHRGEFALAQIRLSAPRALR